MKIFHSADTYLGPYQISMVELFARIIFINKLHSNWHLLVKVNNGNSRTVCEIFSKLTKKTQERRQ